MSVTIGRATVHHGDCLEVLPQLDAESVDAVVTDPPYHLVPGRTVGEVGHPSWNGNCQADRLARRGGFMGKAWDGGDVAFRPETWAAVARVMKPGAFLVAFSSARGYHRMACAIEDGGFIIHPLLGWITAQGFPKATRVDAEGWEGWRYGSQAMKPAIEPICLAQKPRSERTGTANVLKWGVGALNIDACRIPVTDGQRPDGNAEWASDQNLCPLCADGAAKQTRHGAPATRASTATKPAEPTTSARGIMPLLDTGRPDTGCSDGTTAGNTAISLSTAASGKKSTGQSRQDTFSTTSTATRATTGSRTCSACGMAITSDTIASFISPESKSWPQGLDSSGSAWLASDLIQNGLSGSEQEDARNTIGSIALGRFPPNVCHDGSPEVLAAFAAFGERNSAGLYPSESEGTGLGVTYMPTKRQGQLYKDTGTAARFFFSAKADTDDRAGSSHPTVKPLALMEWLVRLVTPPGGTVLDPFAGTGVTGEACLRQSFHAVLIEREADYHRDAVRRLGRLSGADTPLFAGEAA